MSNNFGPESTNPRQRRAYAHTLINGVGNGIVSLEAAHEAIGLANQTRKGRASNFQRALEAAKSRKEIKADDNLIKLVGNMRLTEAEIMIATKFSGDASSYEVDYRELAEGQEVNFQTEGNKYEVSRYFRVMLDTLVDGVTPIRGREDIVPPVKLFEATVLETDREHIEAGEEVFGLIFPEGFAVLVDSGPDEGYTDRRIHAGLVLAAAGKL